MMNSERRAILACVMMLCATSSAQAFAVSAAPRQRAPAALRSRVLTACEWALGPSRGCGFRKLGMVLPGIGSGPAELLSRVAEVCLALEIHGFALLPAPCDQCASGTGMRRSDHR